MFNRMFLALCFCCVDFAAAPVLAQDACTDVGCTLAVETDAVTAPAPADEPVFTAETEPPAVRVDGWQVGKIDDSEVLF